MGSSRPGWVVVCSSRPPVLGLSTEEELRARCSGLLYIVWLLYGNDYDVAVPSVFL